MSRNDFNEKIYLKNKSNFESTRVNPSNVNNINEIEKWHFERNEKAANYLLGLVLSGKKRATSSCYYGYTSNDLPKVGNLSIITYFDGTSGCLIKTTNVRIIPFNEVTFDLARLEGEDESLESWQKTHIKFFIEEGKEEGYEFTMSMPVVFEEFEVLEIY